MDEIKDIVKEVIKKISDKSPQAQEEVRATCEELFKKHKIRHTKIVQIKEDSVTVHVNSPAWLYQCRMKKNAILKEMKKSFPEIQKMYFRIGRIK